jgi:hypothetical protein
MTGFQRIMVIVSLLLAAMATHASPVEKTDALNTDGDALGMLSHMTQAGQRMGQDATKLVFNAMGLLGVPYRRAGESKETGFDCSGFVRAVFDQTLGLTLPRNASQQAASTERIDKTDLQPGDMVFFNTMRRAFSHVGIYVGDGKFIHAPRSGADVRVESMRVPYWRRRFDGARRVERAVSQTANTPQARQSMMLSE